MSIMSFHILIVPEKKNRNILSQDLKNNPGHENRRTSLRDEKVYY